MADVERDRAALVLSRVAEARAELARVETKAGVLAGLSGAAVTVMLATAAARPWLRPAIVGWVSVAAFTGSTVVLLVALRPALRRGVGLLRTASLAPDVVLEESAERAGRADMEMRETAALAVLLSGLAVRKYRLVRAAVDLALLGLVLASVATGLAVWL
ncbi:Pycsar system effector family protein [Actinopolymorpha pittospori]|uniref:Pycsar effector protein domain-containing protein n=1 Tax=Actinopolymorpha pittospori TaxID=648752 RepID=A0A927N4Q7_9ACTN|nr:hypothetical protein [Actinopolymorpha pittospori]